MFVQNVGYGQRFHIGFPDFLAEVVTCPKMQVGGGVGAVGSIRWALAEPPDGEDL